MYGYIRKKIGFNTLRSYITLTITGTVALILIFCSIFFYYKTSRLLSRSQEEQLIKQLGRVNEKVGEQIRLIDSLNTQFMSNTLIRDQVEPSTIDERERLAVEKQMGYLLINNYLWHEGMINSACIFKSPDRFYYVSMYSYEGYLGAMKEAAQSVPADNSSLVIRSSGDSIYFIRNLYSFYTGERIATTVFGIDKRAWSNYFNSNMDEEWTVYLFSGEMSMMTRAELEPYGKELSRQAELSGGEGYFDELSVGGQDYLAASTKVANTDIVSMVIAPKNQMVMQLNQTLRVYWIVLLASVGAAIIISLSLSGAIIKPVRHMIRHMNLIARGDRETPMPSMEMYSEFNHLTEAFNDMLEQLNTYYKDNMEKQILLKNSEIRSLQAQMDPHFLFNTLNTIAWKAQMTGNEEIYQMVISLGELLKTNIVAKESHYTTLGEELQYVRLYTYLQKMRFEDKINVELSVSPDLYGVVIPRFCIQPLVENAFVHGLEPKKGSGKLAVNVIRQDGQLEINVLDNGIGFQTIPDIQSIQPSETDGHTHIGLRNLDRRLKLLLGEEAGLKISSVPCVCTTISFHVLLDQSGKEEEQKP